MSNLTAKLSYLLNTKTAIRNAITSKGQTISDSDTFRSYASKISAIETGSDILTESDVVYIDTSLNTVIRTGNPVKQICSFLIQFYESSTSSNWVLTYNAKNNRAVFLSGSGSGTTSQVQVVAMDYSISDNLITIDTAFILSDTAEMSSSVVSYIPK